MLNNKSVRTRQLTYLILNGLFASVWMINGLFCKILDMVPRHNQIVGHILRMDNPRPLTVIIGVGELLIACWIVAGIRPRLVAWFQMACIVLMNVIEFFAARDLLLWGRLNLVFAICLVGAIYVNEFVVNPLNRKPII